MGCSHLLALEMSAAVKTFVPKSLRTCLQLSWVYTWEWNSWAFAITACDLLRHYLNAFHSGCSAVSFGNNTPVASE